MNVLVFDAPVESLPPAALVDTDIVILASDNLAAEVCVGQMCAWLGKPLVHVSVTRRNADRAGARVHQWSWRGVAVPALRVRLGGRGAPACRGQHFPCDGGIAPTPPTMSTSALCALGGFDGRDAGDPPSAEPGEPLGDAIPRVVRVHAGEAAPARSAGVAIVRPITARGRSFASAVRSAR
jgi:hypothetical protein